MPTLPDFAFVALFAIAVPLYDYLVFWPATARRLQADPAGARMRLWRGAVAYPWALVAIGATLWVVAERPWQALGFSVPAGWRLWTAVAATLLLLLYYVQAALAVARDAATRASVRQQFTGKLARVLPRTRAELTWFGGVALTAGFCEEFLFRGYLIWALAPTLSWWGAAAASLAIFAAGHAYQGWSGVVRTAVVGALFTLVVAALDSLWPAIILHSLVDLGGGVLAWLALREEAGAPPA